MKKHFPALVLVKVEEEKFPPSVESDELKGKKISILWNEVRKIMKQMRWVGGMRKHKKHIKRYEWVDVKKRGSSSSMY